MGRMAVVLWMVISTTLAGIFIVVVLVVPSLAENDVELMFPAAGLGCVVAIPISYAIAKKMSKVFQ